MDIDSCLEQKQKFSDKIISNINQNMIEENKNPKMNFITNCSIIMFLTLTSIILNIFNFKSVLVLDIIILTFQSMSFIFHLVIAILLIKYFKQSKIKSKKFLFSNKFYEIVIIFLLEIELFLSNLSVLNNFSYFKFFYYNLNNLKFIVFLLNKKVNDFGFSYIFLFQIKSLTTIISIITASILFIIENKYKNFLFLIFSILFFYFSTIFLLYINYFSKEKIKKLISINKKLLKIINFLGFIIERKNINFQISFEIEDPSHKENDFSFTKENLFTNNFLIELQKTKYNNLKFLNFNNFNFNNLKFLKNQKNEIRNFNKSNNKIYTLMKDSSLLLQDSNYFSNKNLEKNQIERRKNFRKKEEKSKKKFSTSFPMKYNLEIPRGNGYNINQNYKKDYSAPLDRKKNLKNKYSLKSNSKKNDDYNNPADRNSIYFIKSNNTSQSLNKDNSSKKNLRSNSVNSFYGKAESGFESNISSEESEKIFHNKSINESFFNENSDILEFKKGSSSLLEVKVSKPIKQKISYDRIISNVNEKEFELRKISTLKDKDEHLSVSEQEKSRNDIDYNIEVNFSKNFKKENTDKLRTPTLKPKKQNFYTLRNYSYSAMNLHHPFQKKGKSGVPRSLTTEKNLERIIEVNEDFTRSKTLKSKKKSKIINNLSFSFTNSNKIKENPLVNEEIHNSNISDEDSNIQFKPQTKQFKPQNHFEEEQKENIGRNASVYPYRRNKTLKLPVSNSSDVFNDSNNNLSFPREIQLMERSRKFSSSLINLNENNNNEISENNHNSISNSNNIEHKSNENNEKKSNDIENNEKINDGEYVVFLAENYKLKILNKLDQKSNNNLFSNNDYIYSEIINFLNEKKIISLKMFNNFMIKTFKSYEQFIEDFIYFGPLDIIKYDQIPIEEISNSENKLEEKKSNNNNEANLAKENIKNNPENKLEKESLLKVEDNPEKLSNKKSLKARENIPENQLEGESFISKKNKNNKVGQNSEEQESNRIIEVPPVENSYNEKKINNIDKEIQKLAKSNEDIFHKHLTNNLEKIRRINFYCFNTIEELDNIEERQTLEANIKGESDYIDSIIKSNSQEQFELKSLNESNGKKVKLFKNSILSNNFAERNNEIDNDNSRSIMNLNQIKLENKEEKKENNKNKESKLKKCWNFLVNFIKCKLCDKKNKIISKKFIFAIEEVMYNSSENDNIILEEIKDNSTLENFMSSENLNNFNFNRNSIMPQSYSEQINEYCPFSFDLNFSNPLKPSDYSNQLKKSLINQKKNFEKLSNIQEEKETYDKNSSKNLNGKISNNIDDSKIDSINQKEKKLFSIERSNTNILKKTTKNTANNNEEQLNNSDPILFERGRKIRGILVNSSDNNSFINNEYTNNIISSSSQSSANSKNFIINLSALLHDFKHVVYDNMIFFDFLVMKYIHPIIGLNNSLNKSENNDNSSSNNNSSISNIINNDQSKKVKGIFESGNIQNVGNLNALKMSGSINSKYNSKDLILIYNFISKLDSDKIKDDMIYLNVMKDYTTSMILNITNFMSDNDFLVGSIDEQIDIIYISNVMVKIFNRRLEYENALIGDFCAKKKLAIQAKFIDLELIRKLKINSNKNMMISLIYNIMSNSYKYTTIGEIEIQVKNIILNRNSYVELKISDTGSGIPNEIIKNWGMAFNLKDKEKGTGLGQYLINTISARLNIQLLKPENKKFPHSGTIIRILIPVFQEKTLIKLNSSKSPYQSNSSNSIITIVNNSINLNQSINFDLFNKEKSHHISISNSYSEMFNDEKLISYLIGNNSNNNIPSPSIENQNNESVPILPSQNDESDKKKDDNKINDQTKNTLLNNRLSLSSRKNLDIGQKVIARSPRTLTIICLDDDPVFLSLIGNNLRKWSSTVTDFKFNLIFTNSFTNFFKEFYTLIENEIIPDYFIMDQNISANIKGVECCQLVNEFFKIYLKNEYLKHDFSFFFFTEESNMMNYKIIKKEQNLIQKECIFGKLQITELINVLQKKLNGMK